MDTKLSEVYPPEDGNSHLNMFHAGMDKHPVIFRLLCTDKLDDKYGLHHGMVKAACVVVTMKNGQIIPAGSQYVKEHVEHAERRSYDAILPTGDYLLVYSWYKICRSLAQWKFDDNLIPPQWVNFFSGWEDNRQRDFKTQAGCMSCFVRERDNTCRVTSCTDGTSAVYIVPKTEVDWYWAMLLEYNDNIRLARDKVTDDISNAFLLRMDLLSTMDNFIWTPAVKFNKLVCHYMSHTYDQGCRYHNQEMATIVNGSMPHFWSRFALTILKQVVAHANDDLYYPEKPFWEDEDDTDTHPD